MSADFRVLSEPISSRPGRAPARPRAWRRAELAGAGTAPASPVDPLRRSSGRQPHVVEQIESVVAGDPVGAADRRECRDSSQSVSASHPGGQFEIRGRAVHQCRVPLRPVARSRRRSRCTAWAAISREFTTPSAVESFQRPHPVLRRPPPRPRRGSRARACAAAGPSCSQHPGQTRAKTSSDTVYGACGASARWTPGASAVIPRSPPSPS